MRDSDLVEILKSLENKLTWVELFVFLNFLVTCSML